MNTSLRPLMVLGLVTTGLVLGACGTRPQIDAEAPATAMAFVHALGRNDGPTACALMSEDYRILGFQGDGLTGRAPCLERVAALTAAMTTAEAAEYASASIVAIDIDDPDRTVVHTSGTNHPLLVEVIHENGQAKVDDAA